jgi:hypothetical protein
MSSIYLSDQLKSKLLRAARRRGYVVERGRQSQLPFAFRIAQKSDSG